MRVGIDIMADNSAQVQCQEHHSSPLSLSSDWVSVDYFHPHFTMNTSRIVTQCTRISVGK